LTRIRQKKGTVSAGGKNENRKPGCKRKGTHNQRFVGQAKHRLSKKKREPTWEDQECGRESNGFSNSYGLFPGKGVGAKEITDLLKIRSHFQAHWKIGP